MPVARYATAALLAVSILLSACGDDGDDVVDLSGEYLVLNLVVNGVDQGDVGGFGEFSEDAYDVVIEDSEGNPVAESVGFYEALQDGTFLQDGTIDFAEDGLPAFAVECTGTWDTDDGDVLELVANCTNDVVIAITLAEAVS